MHWAASLFLVHVLVFHFELDKMSAGSTSSGYGLRPVRIVCAISDACAELLRLRHLVSCVVWMPSENCCCAVDLFGQHGASQRVGECHFAQRKQ